jgi:SAM-dependent methyltransferase
MNTTANCNTTNKSFEFKALEEASNYRKAIIQEFLDYLKGHILEVGAGVGQLTSKLLQLKTVETLTAIEPDSELADQFEHIHPSIKLIRGTIEQYTNSPVNTIVTVNVLEHIENDVVELSKYKNILAPNNGYLCLFVPARQEIYAPLDRDFGHYRRYSRSELRNKLTKAGFTITKLHYFNITGYFAWWLNFRILRSRCFNPKAVRIYDRLVFPLVHSLESNLCRPPIGQSVLAIAKASPPQTAQ